MEIRLIQFGKTSEKYLQEGIAIYEKRLQHYTKYSVITLPEGTKKHPNNIQLAKQVEAELLQKNIESSDVTLLLDEKGKHYTSVEFANQLENYQLNAVKRVNFVIGGAYGFTPEAYALASATLSFSKMTFSHQMIRLFFSEQLYRAFTIINNEKYHNN